jgi:hypothetical protein
MGRHFSRLVVDNIATKGEKKEEKKGRWPGGGVGVERK